MTSTSRHLSGILLVASGLALIPWIGLLLGSVDVAGQGPISYFWVGLDAVEMVGLLGAGAAALGVAWLRPWLATLCAVTAMLLVTDAVVDVSTAADAVDVVIASTMAVLAELPLAVVCLSLLAPATARSVPPGLPAVAGAWLPTGRAPAAAT